MIVKRIAILLLCTIGLSAIYAQTPDYTDSFNESLFELYLEKAYEAEDADEWRRLTEQGISLVRADWDTAYQAMLSDDELSSQGDTVENNLRELTEDYFEIWLADKFYKRINDIDWQALYGQIRESNDRYLMADDSTSENPQFKGAENFEADSEAWKNEVLAKIESLAGDWESGSISEIDGILADIAPEDRDAFQENIETGLAVRKILQIQEMEKAYLDCFNRFRRYRLYDSESLRFQTEQEKADQVAQNILEQTQIEINEGLARIRDGLDEEVGYVDYEGEIIDGDNWQEAFRIEMEKGLALWDSAEQALLIERSQWERDAEAQWLEGEQAWADAFEKLSQGREQWLMNYSDLLTTGQQKFLEEEQNISELLTQAQNELENHLTEKKSSLHSRIDTYTQILTDSIGMVQTSRQSWEYWAEKIGFSEDDIDNTEWDQWSMVSRMVKDYYPKLTANESNVPFKEGNIEFINYLMDNVLPTDYNDESAYDLFIYLIDNPAVINNYAQNFYDSKDVGSDPVLLLKYNSESMFDAFLAVIDDIFNSGHYTPEKEAIYWAGVMKDYSTYALDSREDLAENYGVVVSGKGEIREFMPGEDGESELILDPSDINWKDFILDEAQVELLKAKSLLSFWQREEQIAADVLAYSNNNSSGREEEEETLEALNSARDNYNLSVESYNTLVELLETLNSSITDNQTEIAAVRSQLAAKQQELEEQRNDLTNLIMANSFDDSIFKYQLREKYEELRQLYKLDPDTGISVIDQSLIDYMSAFSRYNLESEISRWADEFNELIAGDLTQNPPYLSFQTLKDNRDSLNIDITDSDVWSFNGNSYTLEDEAEFDNFITDVKETLNNLNQTTLTFNYLNQVNQENANVQLILGNLSDEDSKAYLRESYLRIATILQPLQLDLYGQLAQREEELKILSAATSSELYGSHATIEEYIETIESESENISTIRLHNRITDEKALLERFYTSIDEGNWPGDSSFNWIEVRALELYANGEDDNSVLATTVAENIDIVTQIIDLLNNDDTEGLRTLKNSSDLAAKYLTGGSPFIKGSVDTMAFLMTSGRDEVIAAQVRVTAMYKQSRNSAAFRAYYREESLTELKSQLESLQVYDSDSDQFIDPEDIALTISTSDEAIDLLKELKSIEQINLAGMPDNIRAGYQAWFDSLQSYLVVKLEKNSITFSDPGAVADQDDFLDYQEAINSVDMNVLEKSLLFYETWNNSDNIEEIVDYAAYEIAKESFLSDTDFSESMETFRSSLTVTNVSDITFFDNYSAQLETRFNSIKRNIELLHGDATAANSQESQMILVNKIRAKGGLEAPLYPVLNFDEIVNLDFIYWLEDELNALGDSVTNITTEKITEWQDHCNATYGGLPGVLSSLAVLTADKSVWQNEISVVRTAYQNRIKTYVESLDSDLTDLFENGINLTITSMWDSIENKQSFDKLESFLTEALTNSVPMSSVSYADRYEQIYSLAGGDFTTLYIKEQLFNGVSADELGLDVASLPDDIKVFYELQNIQNSYMPIFDNSVEEYIRDNYSDIELQDKLIDAVTYGSWDDKWFLGTSSSPIDSLILNYQQTSERSIGQYFNGVVSDLEVRKNNFYEEYSSYQVEAGLYEISEKINDAITHYRVDLADNLVVDGKSPIELDEASAVEAVDGEELIQATNKINGYLIEYYNNTNSFAFELSEAIDSYSNEENSSDSWNWNNRVTDFTDSCKAILNLADIGDTRLNWNSDFAVQSDYNSAYSLYSSYKSGEWNAKNTISNLADTIAQKKAAEGSDAYAADLEAHRIAIEQTATDIAELDARWQELIDGGQTINFDVYDSIADWQALDISELSYKHLEQAYGELLSLVEDAEAEMDDLRQVFDTAQGIYDYASGWYLETESDLTAAEQQAYDAVDPQNRYDWVKQQTTRALAAVNAITDIVENRNEPDLYNNDGVYKALYDGYQETYRERLAITRIEEVLNAGIAEQQRITQDAHIDWQQVKSEFFRFAENPDDDLFEPASDDPDENSDLNSDTGKYRNINTIHDTDYSKMSISFTADGYPVILSNQWGDSVDVDSLTDADRTELEEYLFNTAGEGERSLNEDIDKFLRELSEENSLSEKLMDWQMAMIFEDFLYQKGITFEEYEDDTATYGAALASYLDSDGGLFSAYYYKGDKSKVESSTYFKNFRSEIFNTYKQVKNEDNGQYDFYRFLSRTNSISFNDNLYQTAIKYIAAEALDDTKREIEKVYDRTMREAAACAAIGWLNPVVLVYSWVLATDANFIKNEELSTVNRDYNTASGSYNGSMNSIQSYIDTIESNRTSYEEELEKLNVLLGQGDDLATSTEELAMQSMIAFDLSELNIGNLLVRYGLLEESDIDNENRVRSALEDLFDKYDRSDEEDVLSNSHWVAMLKGDSLTAFEVSENNLNEYLYSLDESAPGLARTQQISAAEANAIAQQFYSNGHLELIDNPDEIETLQNIIDEWIDSDEDTKDDTFIAEVNDFLTRIYGSEDSNEVSIKQIREILTVDEDSELVDCIALAQTVQIYINGAELGQLYVETMTETYQNPIFSEREHKIRLVQDHLPLIDSLTNDIKLSSSSESLFLISEFKKLLAGEGVQSPFGDIALQDLSLYDLQSQRYHDVRMNQLINIQRENTERRRLWENQMTAILVRGKVAWREAQQKLNAEYNTWSDQYTNLYLAKADEWNEKYLDFATAKANWVADLTEKATQIGSDEVLASIGQSAEDAIDGFSDSEIEAFVMETLNPEELVNSVLDRETLDHLISAASQRTNMIGGLVQRKVYINTRNSYLSSKELQAIKDYQDNNNEEMKGHMAILQFDQMMESLKAAQEALDSMVESSNENFSDNMDETFTMDGYVLKGNTYVKDVIIGATIWNPLYEEKKVTAFNFFDDYRSDFDQSILGENYDPTELGFEGIQTLIAKGKIEVQTEQERIFGVEGEESIYTHETAEHHEAYKPNFWESLWNSVKSIVGVETVYEESFTVNDSQDITDPDGAGDRTVRDEVARLNQQIEDSDLGHLQRIVSQSPGEFGKWVGYAPQLKHNASAEKSLADNTLFQGKGEMGRMMGSFMQNSIIEAKGLAEAHQPIYDRKIWDDRNFFIDSFTIRSVVDLGMDIVGMACGGVVSQYLLGLADDLVFTMLDTANGKDSSLVWGEFGKKALSSAIGVGLSYVSTDIPILDEVIDNIAYSAVGAIQYEGDGNWGYNWQSFTDGFIGKEAVTGYLSNSVNRLVTGAINGELGSTKQGQDSTNVTGEASINSFSGFFGSLAGMGVEYAMTGETSINILNVTDFMSSGYQGTGKGLFELSFSNDNGIRGRVGSGGTNLSFSRFRSFFNSFETIGDIYDGKYGTEEEVAAFEMFAALGNSGNAEYLGYAQRLFRGEESFTWTDGVDENGEYLGMEEDGNIYLSRELIGDSLDSIAIAASGLIHERNHALGNDVEALAYYEQLMGYQSIVNGMVAQGLSVGYNQGHMNGLFSQLYNQDNYYANEGAKDYWKLMDDWTLQYDGRANLYDEDGNLLLKVIDGFSIDEDQQATGQYVETGLARILGITNQEAALLMANSGLQYSVADGVDTLDTNNWSWNRSGMNQINKLISGFDAPSDMLFLLGSEKEYAALVARDEMQKLEPGRKEAILSGLANLFARGNPNMPSDFSDPISYEEWMETRIDSSPFENVDLGYPDSIGAFWYDSLFVLPDLYPCSNIAGYRGVEMLADESGVNSSEVYEALTNDPTVKGLFYSIALGQSQNWIEPELRGGGLGSLLTIAGFGDGVNQYNLQDMLNGTLNQGAITTWWLTDDYSAVMENGAWTNGVNDGHTGIFDRVEVLNAGTDQELIQFYIGDQNTDGTSTPFSFYTSNSSTYYEGINDIYGANVYRSWDDTTFLGTHLYNDLNQRKLRFGLMALETEINSWFY